MSDRADWEGIMIGLRGGHPLENEEIAEIERLLSENERLRGTLERAERILSYDYRDASARALAEIRRIPRPDGEEG